MPSQNESSSEISLLKTYKAEIILLIVTFSWGLSFPLIKISLNFISPLLFVFLRFFITLIVFSVFFYKKIDFRKYKEWKYGLILGIFLFLGFTFQTLGLKFTSASKSAFITGTSLIFIPFAQYIILKSKPKAENIFGAVIVMAGLYILSEAFITVANKGDVLTLLCAGSFAVHIVFLDKYSRHINFYCLVFGQFLAMAVLSLVFVLVTEVYIYHDIFFIPNVKLILAVIYSSLFSTLISIILMTKYQQETTPLRAGIIYNMESLFAVFFAFIILGEILNLSQILGAGIMLAGLFISEFYPYIKCKISNEKKS